MPLHKSKTTYIPRLNSIPFSFDYTMCTNNVYMVMKNRALIKGFFQLFFFFLIFLQKAKKPTPSHIITLPSPVPPYHHFKTGKENLKKRKIFTKKIFSVVTSLAIKKNYCLVFRYKIQPKTIMYYF